MSAKDTADAILRDFRTSMATSLIYKFDTPRAARECFMAMEEDEYVGLCLHMDTLTLTVVPRSERTIGAL